MENLKDEIREFWTRYPCARNLISHINDEKDFFATHDKIIDRLTPYHPKVFNYELCRSKKVLEVGCGMGSHAWRFARFAKEFYAIDLSPKSIELTKRRFRLHNLNADGIREGDAENLPFKANYFDFVYSNGVIHHTPNTQKAADEIYRVLKPGGKTVVMIYNKNSIFYWFDLMLIQRVKYVLLKSIPESLIRVIFSNRPAIFKLKESLNRTQWRDLGSLALRFSDGHFNPSTKVYTSKEAEDLFAKFKAVRVELHATSDRLLEKIKFIRTYFAWGLYIYAEK